MKETKLNKNGACKLDSYYEIMKIPLEMPVIGVTLKSEVQEVLSDRSFVENLASFPIKVFSSDSLPRSILEQIRIWAS